MKTTIRIAYDITLKRPACAILAAMYGGDLAAVHAFNSDDWLVERTPDMKVYEVTPNQLRQLVEMSKTSAI